MDEIERIYILTRRQFAMSGNMKKLLTFIFVVGLIANVPGQSPTWAGPPPNPTMSDGNGNTAGGTDTLFNLTFGANNTGFGAEALNQDSTGNNNTAVGGSALFSNTSGSGNTATGTSAMLLNTMGSNKSATGIVALSQNA